MHGKKTPLLLWFKGMWILSRSSGLFDSRSGMVESVSFREFSEAMGFSTDSELDAWLERLRPLFCGIEQDNLNGHIQAAPCIVPDDRENSSGRGYYHHEKVLVAVEVRASGNLGRVRLRQYSKASKSVFNEFIQDIAMPGSAIETDGGTEWSELSGLGFDHSTNVCRTVDPAMIRFESIRAISLYLNRWLHSVHNGDISIQFLESFLDEFVMRFNARQTLSTNQLFDRLLDKALKSI